MLIKWKRSWQVLETTVAQYGWGGENFWGNPGDAATGTLW